MKVSELQVYKDQYRNRIATDILTRQYLPTAIKGTVRRCGRDFQIKWKDQTTRRANSRGSLASTGGKSTISTILRSQRRTA